jgi:hypothetical protein
MDDRFLTTSRREPDPEFVRGLRARLRTLEAAEPERRAPRWRAAVAGALAVAALAVLFTLPAVRVTAQQVLDLFRVRDFAVVPIDEARVEQLKARRFDPQSLLGGNVEKLQDPGPPRAFTSIDAATPAAGFTPARPTDMPRRLQLDSVFVSGESRERVTVDTRPLRELMDAFEIRDLSVPAGLDGQHVTIHVPPVVVQSYRNDRQARVRLLQSSSPELSMPAGVDLPRLGEIGLRLLGLQPGEANRLAHAIDWRSTLLVPVASSATTFQQVTVHGAKGVYLETSGAHAPGGADSSPASVLLWSRDERVFALIGNVDQAALVTMAESVR